MRTNAETGGVRDVVEIACDESGFVGGSLFGGTRVFAHAGVLIDPDAAVELADEVRRRTGAGPDELKASRLNRPWGQPVAAWLCGAEGPLSGRATVHVTDTRLFGLARLAQVLLGDASPEGWWSAREDPRTWDLGLRLHSLLSGLPPAAEERILDSARDLLWQNRRHRRGAAVEVWADAVAAVAQALEDADECAFLSGWAAPEPLRRARAYLAEPPGSPLTEPLLPALRWAVRHWSALGDVHVVHDEQSVLTSARVAAIGADLASTSPGRRLVGLARVDSRHDARVQIADLVAGVVRRTVEEMLEGGGASPAVPIAHLVAPESAVLAGAALTPGGPRWPS